MRPYILFLAVCLVLSTGCTSKQVYQFGKNYEKSECINKAATEEDHRACENLEQQSFEEYEEERKRLKQTKQVSTQQ